MNMIEDGQNADTLILLKISPWERNGVDYVNMPRQQSRLVDII